MANSLLLFLEFFKVGLFTFGGGYASLPFLYNMVDSYNWFTQEQLIQLIAISGLTPGPIGLNMATFAGFHTLGIKGGIFASFALILPMVIVTSLVFKLYKKFKTNRFVKRILYVLKPTSCALIASVGLKLCYNLIIAPKDFLALILVIILFLLTFKLPRNPVYYMGFAAIFAIILFLFKLI